MYKKDKKRINRCKDVFNPLFLLVQLPSSVEWTNKFFFSFVQLTEVARLFFPFVQWNLVLISPFNYVLDTLPDP